MGKADPQRDLEDLLALRAQESEAPARRERLASFGEPIASWLDAGCPTAAPARGARHAKQKSANTVANARSLLTTHVRPVIGKAWVDRTKPERIEGVFRKMATAGYATSTIDTTWSYLNQACEFGLRERRVRTNPAQGVLLPEARPAKERKSLTIEQVARLLNEAIPQAPAR